MRKFILLLSFNLICLYQLFPQGIDNLWLYGGIVSPITSINFFSGSPVVSIGAQYMPQLSANANVCDTSGHLLFYTNGCYINNAYGDTMVNGSGLNPSACTNDYCSDGLPLAQADLILPSIGSSGIYYLFHMTCDYLPIGLHSVALYYSIVDMTLDSGRGAVISKNNVVINDTLTLGLLTAVKHGNGRDWWIVVPKYDSNIYHILLLTPDGIIQNTTQQIGNSTGPDGGVWQAVFSPDGSRYANYIRSHDVDLMKFDRCTGTFFDYQHLVINDSMNAGGIAFSPNSNVLYVSSMLYMYQFNAAAPNVQSTKMTIGVYDGFQSPLPFLYTTFYLSQLAPDGKIYTNSSFGVDYLHTINHPDSLGLACDFQQHSLFLQVENGYSIPNHPNYHLGSIPDGPCDTLTTEYSENERPCSLVFSPNPFIDKINFHTKGKEKNTLQPISIQIFNMQGDVVMKKELLLENKELDLAFLPVGIYIIAIETRQCIFKRKLVKVG